MTGIVLEHPKREVNVGGALRAAHMFGADWAGIIGKPYTRVSPDTSNALKWLPHKTWSNTFEWLMDYPGRHGIPVVVERHVSAKSLVNFRHPQNAVYYFGPESGDVSAVIVGYARAHYGAVVEIPTKHSLNLSQAVAIVLYDRLAKA